MKKRFLFTEIQKKLKHKNALIITGMRQVGKTTLMRQVYDELGDKAKLWFDFDNPFDQKIFEEIDYKTIYARLKSLSGGKEERLFVFLDEIQNFPEVTKVMKVLIDHYGVKFIVTGSSSFYLRNLFPESLTGRKFLYELPPLQFQEFLYFRGKIPLRQTQEEGLEKKLKQKAIDAIPFTEEYDEYLHFGGFPEVVITPNRATKRQILKNILSSFFEKDLKLLSDYKDIKDLRDLILLLVPRVGSMLDISKISSELSLDRGKVYSYLEFLQSTFFIKLLPKYSKSIDRSVAGGKKVYFTDTGLLSAVGSVNDAQLFENAVVNQLSPYGHLSFYNKHNTAEIDLILDKKMAFEIKLRATESDGRNVKKLAKTLGFQKSFVISRDIVEKPGVLYPMIF